MSKIIVRGLPWSMRDDRLRSIFSAYGEMSECKVVMESNDPTRSRGFAFITFQNPQDAQKAIQAMDGREVDGRRINISPAEERGSRGGGSGGDRYGGSGGGRYGSSRGDERSSYGRSDDRGYGRERERGDDRGYGRQSDRGYDRERGDRGYGGRDEDRGYGGRNDRGYGGRDYSDKAGDRDRSPGRADEQSKISSDRKVIGGGGESARDESNQNARIYITGLPPDITEEDLQQHFGMLGQVARRKQKRGYPDQWPYKISIYMENGKCKGDACLTYEDFNAAQSAPEFFNGSSIKGNKITVTMAEEKEKPDMRQSYQRGRGDFDRGGRY